MSTSINFDLLSDAKVSAFNARHPEISRVTPVQQIAAEGERFGIEEQGWSISGDHLGTHAHREETFLQGVGWVQGEEISRERIHHANVNVWDMVAA